MRIDPESAAPAPESVSPSTPPAMPDAAEPAGSDSGADSASHAAVPHDGAGTEEESTTPKIETDATDSPPPPEEEGYSGPNWAALDNIGGTFLSIHGYLESDLRYQVENYRGRQRGQGFEVDLQQNIANLRLEFTPLDNLFAVLETKLWFYGYSNIEGLSDLTRRDKIDPFVVQLDQAHVVWRNALGLAGLDLTLGRTSIGWGAADVFNPTDVISSRDFRDPLVFTARVPNELVKIDWAHDSGRVGLTFVWVPLFRPAQLPPSAPIALESTDTMPPLGRADAERLKQLFEDQEDALELLPFRTHVGIPKFSFPNSQFAARVNVDIPEAVMGLSLTYYYGRFAFPQPLAINVQLAAADPVTGKSPVHADVYLYYPRFQMVGFDVVHAAPWLWDTRLFAEVAVFFPEKVTFAMRAPPPITELMTRTNIDKPFMKATAGFDYAFTEWFYMNVQYIYGFFDEFGDFVGLKHHIAPALEFRGGSVTLRLAGVATIDDASGVLFPQLFWQPLDPLRFTFGGLVYLGGTKPRDPLEYGSTPRFGAKAVGRSVVYAQMRFSF